MFSLLNTVSAESLSSVAIQAKMAEACGEKPCDYIFKQMKKYAKNGSPHAQATLSLLYLGGFGTEMNTDLSVKYMKRAAKNGLAYAAYKLGMLYREGQLLEKDDEQADHWLHRAAKSGYKKAIDLLISEKKINKDTIKDYQQTVVAPVINEGEEVLQITAEKFTLTKLHDLLKSRGFGNSRQTGSRIKGVGCHNSGSPCTSWNINSAVGRTEFNSMISKINAIQTAIEMSTRGG